MPTLHAIVRTDLCEETIVETYAKAEDAAAFMDRQPDGAPFRIAVLTERIEPVSYAWGTRFDREQRPRPYLTSDSFATAADACRSMHTFARKTKGETTAVYGLVPVEG